MSKALRAYLVVAILVGAALTVQTVRQLWSGDVWQHAASIEAFRSHPLDPVHPLAAGAPDDPYLLNAWAMVWGWVARASGWSAVTTLVLSGVVNLLLVTVGVFRLARRVSAQWAAPALALVSILLLWGVRPWRWSGYPSLNSIGFGLPYPSFLAFGVYLFGLTSVLDFVRTRERSCLVVLAGAVSLSLVCHTLTGVALGGSAVVVATVARDDLRRVLTLVVGAVAIGAVVTLLWPFGHLWDLASAPAAFDEINRRVNQKLLLGAGAALVAAPWALARLEGPAAPALRRLFCVNLAVAAVGFLGGPSAAGRLLPFALLPVQLGFAAAVAGELERPRRRRVVLAGAALLLVVGLIGARGALPRLVPSQLLPARFTSDDRLQRASDQAAVVPEVRIDDPVAIASEVDARLLVARGMRMVSPPYPTATLDTAELERRDRDTDRFLSASPAEQRSIAARYGVDVLVVPADTAAARRVGRVIASSPTVWVVDLSGITADG